MLLVAVKVSDSIIPPCTVYSRAWSFGGMDVDELPRFARPVSYNYDKLAKDHYYVSPSKNHTGDLTCDCNTVMYR